MDNNCPLTVIKVINADGINFMKVPFVWKDFWVDYGDGFNNCSQKPII